MMQHATPGVRLEDAPGNYSPKYRIASQRDQKNDRHPPAVSISVVICAHTEKRWDATLAAVASVRAQHFPPIETILVVDHNPALQARLSTQLRDVRVVANDQEPGLSGGKNTGTALARGDVVAFLDDDAMADPDWLKYFADCYADPTVVAVGGQTVPRWVTSRPRWFPEEFYWVIGCTYLGMPTSLAPVRNLMGGNASFRRNVFATIGGFRCGIGRDAGKLPLGCEETEFCIRLRQNSPGSVLLFENRAVIEHLIPASRCRFSYFRTRCYAEGLSKSLVTANVGIGDGLETERHYVRKVLPMGIARGIIDAARGRPAGLGRAAAIISGLAITGVGYLVGASRPKPASKDPAIAAPQMRSASELGH